ALGGVPHDGKAAHHLIPRQLQWHPVVERARLLGWDMDGVSNGILLPTKKAAGEAESLPVHGGSHRKWNAGVREKLDEILGQGTEERWAGDDERWRKEVEQLVQNLLEQIAKEPPGEILR
ncbi:MAG: AHH domain-containing protein, partial [Chloroflexi bacterium]|nr:AHH domain-containing protein [Chloroflexota bacterium]